MQIILALHSLVRWIVVIIAVLTIGRMLMGWLGRRTWSDLDSRLRTAFTIGLDVQVLIGIVLVIVRAMAAPLERALAGHIVTMVLAIAVAHASAAFRRNPDSARFRNSALVFILALILIGAGVAALPGGWSRPIPGLG